ncbi:hypothetical protein ACQEU8_03770 [Streptomyces sp. CA-250714]|uniref:hypothetical protein n=1 Tax=Streptomyces sp. CA-250714 TaxID=3240060 RepID=UPI003D8DC839
MGWCAAARADHGEAAGTRALIEVLPLTRHMEHDHVVNGLAAAHRAGALTADAVALEARKAAQGETTETSARTGAPRDESSATVTSDWKLSHLPPDTRPLPSVAHYDQLLRQQHGRTVGEKEAS